MKIIDKVKIKEYSLQKYNINKKILKMLKTLEYLGSKRILSSRIYKNLFYNKLVKREIKEAKLKKGMNILHIGCGSLPLTAIMLAEKGYQIKGIDNDRYAISAASKLIEKKGLTKKIKIKEDDGLKIKTDDHDVIWLSLHVFPKKIIIKNLLKQLKPGKKLIYRNPDGILTRFYNKVDPAIFNGINYKIIKQDFAKESIIIEKIKG